MATFKFLGRDDVGNAIRSFASKFDLVYFGHVDHRYDEHAVVRGITASTNHVDKHFAVGNVKQRDLSLLGRTNTLKFPGKGESNYHWVILQVDLRADIELPHIFLDAHHHDDIFYSNLFINFANFQAATSLFVAHDPKFIEHFISYAPSDKFDDVAATLVPTITSMLAHHFTNFDYEFDGATLYVYGNALTLQEKNIEEMARVGLWLADELEKSL